MATQSLIPPNINYGKLSADEYDPNATYSSGDLRIHDNILYKANQDISVAEPWTPAHWDATTIAAELKAQAEDISDLNSSSGLYTPQIYWSESSEPLTVDNVSVRWYKMGNLCIIGGRFNVTDVGNPGNSQLLTISLPDDITLEPTGVMIIGKYISSQEDLYVRGNGNTLSVVHDIGGGYSSQYIGNGYQGFTIVAFCR